MSAKRAIIIIPIVLALAIILSIILSHTVINKYSNPYIYDRIDYLPYNHCGLLLGTSKYLKSGQDNLYFNNRINAAELLFKKGKINNIVISGDNSRKEYNEPQDMKEELIKRGVPEDRIYLDYAGFRTFDSMVRMKEIFGQERFTVISQKFHNQRAVYIAKIFDIDAVGFNAADVSAYSGLKTRLRELFARVKVFIDIIINKKPKFLGEKIKIN